jgi:phosphate transport system substrate-binding protein
MKRGSRAFVASAVAAGLLIAGASAASAASITGGGSSFQGTFQATCAAAYSNHSVTYVASSSGTGKNQFATGNFDFAGTDATYSSSEYKGRPGGYTFVPITVGPIGLAFNVPGVTSLKLDTLTSSKILRGEITKWNDAAIKKLNPGAKLPNNNIVVVYRTASSGTTENLAAYFRALGQDAPGYWVINGTFTRANGKGAPAGSLGFATNQQVVTAVKNTKYTFGYADLADLNAQGVKKLVALKNPAGQYVVPTAASAAKFVSKQNNVQPASGLVGLNWAAKVTGAYNLNAVTYMIGDNGATTEKARAVEDYVNYLLDSCGPKVASKAGYVPLSGKMLTLAKAQAAKISN